MKSPGARRGISLVEILIATLVLAVVVIPVATLIMGGMRRTEVSKHSTIAMAMAANILDSLLSPDVPFAAIDPSGAGAADLVKSLPGIGGGRKQASFTGPDANRLEAIMRDRVKDVGGGKKSRVKVSEEGLEFETFLFAGVYDDKTADKVDLYNELTFTYLPNPYVPPNTLAAEQKVLGVAPPAGPPGIADFFPYTRPFVGSDPLKTGFKPGWPDPPNKHKANDGQLLEDIRTAYGKVGNPDPKYYALFEDQRHFNRPGGGLMKLVLGVRWNPNAHVGKGLGYTKNSKELWLVSFKGDLK